MDSTSQNFLCCEMPDKKPQTLDQIARNLLTQDNTYVHLTSLKGCKNMLFKQILRYSVLCQ